MFSNQFFLRYFLLLIVVEMEESFGQSTLNDMTEMCSQGRSFERGHSEISDQIRSQNEILEKLVELIQKMQIEMNDVSREVESNLKNLSQEVESKWESVQSGYSKLELEMRIRMNNCPVVQTAEV